MMDLTIAAADVDELRSTLLMPDVESCAVLFANELKQNGGRRRLVVREMVFPEPEDYLRRGLLEAELSPDFVARISKRARLGGYAIVWVHTHPGELPPTFSAIDDNGERLLAELLSHRNPGLLHAALVVSEGGVSARELGGPSEMRVTVLGREREVLFPKEQHTEVNGKFDRQVRAFGSAGQRELEVLKVGVVGLGGTGSIVAQELVHLGVRNLVFIDADVLEETNLNRVAEASPADVGRPKVDVAADYALKIAPSATVQAVRGDVTRASCAKKLLDCDVFFGCTDSHGSRSVLQQVAYQYLIPCVDVGATIVVDQGHVRYVSGRVQLLSPGLACFTCGALLDPNEVRIDLMSEFERKNDPYVLGVREPAPAVMSLNSVIAGLGVSMFLAFVTGFPMEGRHLVYDGRQPSLRSVVVSPDPQCYICSREGAFARGDSWELFARKDEAFAH